jgi:hypothetical protein
MGESAGMSRQLLIAPEVAVHLDDAVRAQLGEAFAGPVRCVICTAQITDPNEPVAICVAVIRRAAGPAVGNVYGTHPGCGPSRVHVLPGVRGARPPAGGGTPLAADYLLGLWGGDPHGLLLWESKARGIGLPAPGEPVDLLVAGYLERGFTLLVGLAHLLALPPAPTGWRLELTDTGFSVRDPNGDAAIAGELEGGPVGWREVVRAERAVLAITGTGLRLDQPFDLALLEPAISRGRVVAAVVPLARATPRRRPGRLAG